uniref:Uncharacterized protein n=1 Tax=Chaetoceros debilis TaxID=122233 RepID=A0A7S3PUP9_9STRA
MVSFVAMDSCDIEQGVTTEVPLQEDSRNESHCEEMSNRLDSVENIKSHTPIGPKSLSHQAVMALRSQSSKSARPFSYFHSISATELISKTGRQASVRNNPYTARNDCAVDDDGANGDEERNGFLTVDHKACRTSLSAEEENKGAYSTFDGSGLDRIPAKQANSAKEGAGGDISAGPSKDQSNATIENDAQQSGNEDTDNRDNGV